MDIFTQLKKKVLDTCKSNFGVNISKVEIRFSKNISIGQISISTAMEAASKTKQELNYIAQVIINSIKDLSYFESASFHTSGFINIKLTNVFWHTHLKEIILNNKNYFKINIGKGQNVNIEYASVNPTGPLHIGHARNAVLGDVLSNLMKQCGFNVTKEYYVNDFGSQIDNLIKSVLIRYENVVLKSNKTIPEGLYTGKYLEEIAQVIFKIHSNSLINKTFNSQINILKKFCVEKMVNLIKEDLKKIDIKHDHFFYESNLHKKDDITKVIEILNKKNLIYLGQLPDPIAKTKVKKDSKSKSIIFKSTEFDDLEDRVLQKHDKNWTYFASEVAYIKNKMDRNFDQIITILGADHIGYIKRCNAIFNLLNEKKNAKYIIKICQLVKYIKNGKLIKMSKRAGNFQSLSEIIDLTSKDTLRYMMISRKCESHLDFDINKSILKSNENPIFYIQYANTRAYSILRKAEKLNILNNFDVEKLNIDISKINFSLLSLNHEINLITKLTEWIFILKKSLESYEPHRIAFYTYDIASTFHSIWNAKEDGKSYKFINQEKLDLTFARLSLVIAFIKIIKECFKIIGIDDVRKM